MPRRKKPRPAGCALSFGVASVFVAAAALAGCGGARRALPGLPAPGHGMAAAECAGRIDTVIDGLIAAGYRISSRYDPTSRRPGAITAKSLDPRMEDLSLSLNCDGEFSYSIAGSGVLGLVGKGRRWARREIEARLAGEGGEPPPRNATERPAARVRRSPKLSFLAAAGIAPFEVEIRNTTERPLLVHAAAITLVTPEGSVLGSIDPGMVANRLALRANRLDPETLRAIAGRQLHPLRLAPGEVTRGLVYFDSVPAGQVVVRALTDDLIEVPVHSGPQPDPAAGDR